MGSSKIPGGRGEVKLNRAGVRELMKSSAIESMLRTRMLRVQQALPGSELEVGRAQSRARVKVLRGSDFDEANTGDLSRALDLAGGQRGFKKRTNKKKSRRSS